MCRERLQRLVMCNVISVASHQRRILDSSPHSDRTQQREHGTSTFSLERSYVCVCAWVQEMHSQTTIESKNRS